jgi:hypothetical protein
VLKDMVFARWLAEGCEERSDTLKMVCAGRHGWPAGQGHTCSAVASCSALHPFPSTVDSSSLPVCVCPAIARCVQVGLVSFFLPFFPLERRHLRQLFELRLEERSAELQRAQLGGLQWDAAVLGFLLSKVCRSRASDLCSAAGGASRAGQRSSLLGMPGRQLAAPIPMPRFACCHTKRVLLLTPPLRRSTLTATFRSRAPRRLAR